MSEYISREALLKRLDMASDCKKCPRCVNMKTYYDRCAYTDIQDVCSVISDMPAANVQPIKHGRWIAQGDDMWLCSNCKENIIFSMHESDRTEKQRYCCKCGARMDGDTNDRV